MQEAQCNGLEKTARLHIFFLFVKFQNRFPEIDSLLVVWYVILYCSRYCIRYGNLVNFDHFININLRSCDDSASRFHF